MDDIPSKFIGLKPKDHTFQRGLLVVGAHYDPASQMAVRAAISCPSKFDPVSKGFSKSVLIPKNHIGQVVKVDFWNFKHRPIMVLFPEIVVWCSPNELWILPSELYR